jgi:hypothetical protein
VTKIIKQYRVLYRSADGGATYLAVTGEGSELLMINPVGSRWSSVIEGVDLDQAWGVKDVTVIEDVTLASSEAAAYVGASGSVHIEDVSDFDTAPTGDLLPAAVQFIEPPAEHTRRIGDSHVVGVSQAGTDLCMGLLDLYGGKVKCAERGDLDVSDSI